MDKELKESLEMMIMDKQERIKELENELKKYKDFYEFIKKQYDTELNNTISPLKGALSTAIFASRVENAIQEFESE